VLFTNTDNPHAGSQHKHHQAKIKAEDLGQLDIDVELLHMGSNFDPSLFYKVSEYIRTVLYESCSESKERLRIQPAQLFHCTRSVMWCVQ